MHSLQGDCPIPLKELMYLPSGMTLGPWPAAREAVLVYAGTAGF